MPKVVALSIIALEPSSSLEPIHLLALPIPVAPFFKPETMPFPALVAKPANLLFLSTLPNELILSFRLTHLIAVLSEISSKCFPTFKPFRARRVSLSHLVN